MTGSIRNALQADPDLPPEVGYVQIATNEQAVVLRGALPSAAAITRVETLAQTYAGARQVVNELTVLGH